MADNGVVFRRIGGKVVPIRKKGGQGGGFRGEYKGGGNYRTTYTTNRTSKLSKIAKKFGKRTIAYGGVAAAAYGTKKAWDKSGYAGRGAMLGAAYNLGMQAHALNQVRKNPAERLAFNMAMSSKKGKLLYGAIVGGSTLLTAGFGALAGRNLEKNKKMKAKR